MQRSISRPPAAAAAPLAGQVRALRAVLVQLSRLRPLRDPVAAACDDLELTPAQVHLVMWLGTDGALTMGQLARRVAVTEKTITGVVDRMERDGLVQRERDPSDRRVVHVTLAARGAQLYRRIDGELEAKLARFLGLLDAGDRRHLVRMLEKLTARMAAEET